MIRWPTKPLGEVAIDLQAGFASRPDGDGEGLPHLRPLNITEDGRLIDKGTKRVPCTAGQLRRYDLRAGDILFNNTNSPELVGKVAVFNFDGEFVFSNHLTRIRVDRNQVVPEFVQRFLFLLWSNGHFKRQCTQWINQAAINVEALSVLPVPIPPLLEQERIVRILDEADALRRLRAQADQRTDELRLAIFSEMFGDSPWKESRWPVRSLGKICGPGGIKAGPFGSSLKKDSYTATGPRVYGQEQVIASNFAVGDYHISEEKFAEMQAYVVHVGDVLISLVGTIGRAVVVPDGIEPGIINPRLLRIRPPKEMILPEFLVAILKGQGAAKFFANVAGGITMGVLNATLLKELLVIVPPLELQEEYSARVAEIRELEAAQAPSRGRVDGLFQSLLHRAFEGEL